MKASREQSLKISDPDTYAEVFHLRKAGCAEYEGEDDGEGLGREYGIQLYKIRSRLAARRGFNTELIDNLVECFAKSDSLYFDMVVFDLEKNISSYKYLYLWFDSQDRYLCKLYM